MALSLATFYWKESALGRGGKGISGLHGEAEHDEAFFFPFKGPVRLPFAGDGGAGLQCCWEDEGVAGLRHWERHWMGWA
jgi:hypothetical protein